MRIICMMLQSYFVSTVYCVSVLLIVAHRPYISSNCTSEQATNAHVTNIVLNLEPCLTTLSGLTGVLNPPPPPHTLFKWLREKIGKGR